MSRRPPNLLYIVSDQQRLDSISCYGAGWMEKGALHELAQTSFVFRHTYCTQPVCTPSRATLLTGLYPHAAGMMKNNIVLDPSIRSVAEMVSEDYQCAYYGKWHLGRETLKQHGFDEWVPLAELPWRIDHPQTPYHQFLVSHGVEPDHQSEGGLVYSPKMRAVLPEPLTMASFIGDQAARFIREEHPEPYMLQVHFMEPHNPYTGPLNGLYDPEKIPVGPAFLKRPEDSSLFNRVRAEFYMQGEGPHAKMGTFGADQELSPEQRWRMLRAQYYGNVTLVDRAVGKVLAALEESGEADNTIVVFTSDHGEMAGDHGLLEKRAFYEESAAVPLLISVPWLSRESRSIEGNLGQIDLIPTLLDLMGQTIPDHLQGTSRLPVLRGQETLDDDVYIQWNGYGDRDLGVPEANLLGAVPRRSVVTPDRWKLNLCAGDQGELYNLNADPNELRNLYDDPGQRDRIRLMAARIRLWQQDTGDLAPLPDV